ncbi:hypothetical protein AQUCO_06800066v1 [Aquilegia coerulea]|uniref:Nicotianamine synthase n=1 Tax=Aquilegia coerulea TaxID=218851 RepID=A0A2G5CBH3_AQUCA|nr:hypothetical protein AQUCO_06800066v1 [Aquilegia coerulea]
MASFQASICEFEVPDELLIAQVMQIHVSICELESLRPSKQVNRTMLSLQAWSTAFYNGVVHPKRVAFIGSANNVARQIVTNDDELESRMKFETCDIMEVKDKLGEFDCIFLAALAGMDKKEKMKILAHVQKYMKVGGVLLIRSANGGRAFLYPVVDENDLVGFEVLSIFHPTDDVIDSVVLVRKPID